MRGRKFKLDLNREQVQTIYDLCGLELQSIENQLQETGKRDFTKLASAILWGEKITALMIIAENKLRKGSK